ncbi:MAG TPA: tetratricopeptide repeat protein [Gemmata sp.]|nr:tetratricopeptide repeat protein [Gemmata sp.]
MFPRNTDALIDATSELIANSSDEQEVLEAFAVRAMIYRDRGQRSLAIEDFSECIRRLPGNVDYYKERALLFAEEKRPTEALADFTHVIKTAPDGWTYANRGAMFVRLRQLDLAIDDLQQALTLGNITPEVCFNWGLAHFYKEEYLLAILGFNDALSLNPDYPQALMQRGLSHSRMCEYTRALEDYELAVESNPEYGNGNNNLAWLLATCPDQSIRNGPRALTLAKKACDSVGWTNAHYLGTYAAACAEVERFGDAIQWQEKAIRTPGYFSKPDDEVKAYFRLKLYQEKKPYRLDMNP